MNTSENYVCISEEYFECNYSIVCFTTAESRREFHIKIISRQNNKGYLNFAQERIRIFEFIC